VAKPSFLRRLLLCRFDLCDLWYRKEERGRQGYACAGCDRTSMMRALPRPRDGASIFPRFELDAPIPKPPRGKPLEVRTIAPSLDDLHPAFSEPVTGYMSRTGYELLHVRSGWWTKFCLDRGEINPRGGVVEVEVRLRRVIEG
jgi:hypothetical protein